MEYKIVELLKTVKRDDATNSDRNLISPMQLDEEVEADQKSSLNENMKKGLNHRSPRILKMKSLKILVKIQNFMKSYFKKTLKF